MSDDPEKMDRLQISACILFQHIVMILLMRPDVIPCLCNIKRIEDKNENDFKVRIFQENCSITDEINNEKDLHKLELNKFADLAE